tara:strand:+ start:320466 stop:321431 length:966 start_codon:yes stop_codon:yes gene_type:complete
LGNLYRPISDADCEYLLEAAWAFGLRYFDTAPLYGFGLSERRLGAFLRSKPREEFFVSTKVGRLLKPNAGYHGQRDYFIDADPFEPVFDYSRDAILRAHEDSLERLGLDRIDILLMHDIGAVTHGASHAETFATAMTGGYAAMDELRGSGAVGAIGLGVNEWEVCAEAMARGTWDCMLLAGRHTLLQQDAGAFLDLCIDMNVRVIAAGVFNSGILATGSSAHARFNYDAAPDDIAARVSELARICADFDTPLGAAALQYPKGHPAVISVLAGIGSADELVQTMDWAGRSVPDGLWQALQAKGLLRKELPVPANAEAADEAV